MAGDPLASLGSLDTGGGGLSGGAAGPATSSGAVGLKASASFDNSGWTVSTGTSKATSSTGLSTTTMLLIGGAMLVAFLVWKKAF
jgi:hypothetical protein